MTNQEAQTALANLKRYMSGGGAVDRVTNKAIDIAIEALDAQPEIIFCKDCHKHNVKVGFDENLHTVWKEDACPLVIWRGKAQGHEFDYQYCAYAERRTDGQI